MEKNKLEGTKIEKYFAPGTLYIENIEYVENLFPGDPELIKQVLGKQKGQSEEALETEDDMAEVKEKLNYMFPKGKVGDYLNKIKGESNVGIVRITNEWISNGLINKEYSHRNLWSILSNYGLYTANESNWNQQIR